MWAVQMKECGEPSEVMYINENAPKPEPKPGQALIKMQAFTVNPSDFMHVRGVWASKPDTFPATGGMEGVGVVEKIASNADGVEYGIAPGMRVVFWHGFAEGCTGSWAEYCVIPEKECFQIQQSEEALSSEKAAGVFLNPMTMIGVMDELKMDVENKEHSNGPKSGDWILQNAGNSSCSKFLTQFLKQRGMKVINVVRRSEQVNFLKELGSDVVIATDQNDFVDLKTEVYKVTDGKGVKYALDSIYGSKIDSLLECLDVHGTIVSYGFMDGAVGTVTAWPLILGLRSLRGFAIAAWLPIQPREKIQRLVNISANLHSDGSVKVPTKLFPYINALEGLKLAETPNASTKVVISACKTI